MVLIGVPFIAIILALVAVLFVYAWYKLVYYIALAISPNLPGVFHYITDFTNWLAGKALDAFNSAYNQALSWAESALSPWVTLVDDYVDYSEKLWGAARDTFFAVSTKLRYVTTVEIPNAVSDAVSQSTSVITSDVAAGVQQAVTQSISWSQNEANTVWTNTINLIASEIQPLETVIGGIQASLGAIPQAIDGAEQAAEGWAQGAIDQLQGWTSGAVDALRGELLGGIGAVDGELHGFEGEARGAIGDVAGRVTTLEGMQIIVGGATALATIATIATWVEECGNPLCDNLGGLANILPGILGALEGGALWAMIAYAIHDPSGAARLFEDVATPAKDAADSFVRSL